MGEIAKKYFEGLKQVYLKSESADYWKEFEQAMCGASLENMKALQAEYPEIPDALMDLLNIMDGTYYRQYGDEEYGVLVLGSDVEEYPYYLLSSEEMLENKDMAFEYYADFVNREFDPEDIPVDEKIIDDANQMKWLHFSDCMNNGGTSQLFIDFSPSAKGKKGQIVRFLHDPDSIEVIADSFEEYLEMLMKNGFDFVNEDTGEWYDL